MNTSYKKTFKQSNVDASSLKTIPLFSSLNKMQLNLVRRCSQKIAVRRGCAIIRQDENNFDFYIILSGRVNVSLIHEDGREVSLDTLGRGDFFGELSFLDKKVRSATVTALGDTELLVFPRDTFVNVLNKLHDIMFVLLQALGKRLRQADERIETLTFMDVSGRVSRLFLDLARDKGERMWNGSVKIRCPAHRVIAGQIGASREAVTKAIKSLASKGLIAVKNKEIIIGAKQFEIF